MDHQQTPRERALELVRLLVPDWRPTTTQVLWAIRIAIVFGVLIAIGYPYGITLWDWAQLLIVPTVIAAGGVWFSRQQRERELQIAEQRAQDEALQAYIDSMERLLLDKGLRTSSDNAEARTLARARTLGVLPRLDGSRRGSVVQFLYESGLINRDSPVLSLGGADLSEAALRRANLSGVDLSEAILTEADLSGAVLNESNLSQASLDMANLNHAS